MSRKYRNLMPLIVADGNLREAFRKTSLGHSLSGDRLEFREFAEFNLARMRDEFLSGDYEPDPPRSFFIHDPKTRLIVAASFRDRVAQHALVNVIGPIFERMFLPMSYACREDRGTHAAVRRLQAMMRRLGRDELPVHYLKLDFAKYFASIDRPTLHGLIRRKITCAATLRLIEATTPPEGRGLPIGALTSQLYANLYADQFDRFLLHQLGQRHFVRYMDDTIVLSTSKAILREVKVQAEAFIAETLGLRLSRWSMGPVSSGIGFLGFRVWPTHRLLRRQSVRRARRYVRHLAEIGDADRLRRFLAAWTGHAAWADSHHLIAAMEATLEHLVDRQHAS